MLWGYIGPRYLGDFVPFLVLASAVALADIFRRLEGRRRPMRVAAVAVIAALAVFSIAANIGMAIVPNEEWSTTQLVNYVQAQKTVSDFMGHPLQERVVRGNALPPWGPAGELYVVGNCSGLYISNGENYSTVPTQQYQRTTWMPVELGQPFEHTFQMTVRSTESKGKESIPLLSMGKYTVKAEAIPISAGFVDMTFSIFGGAKVVEGYSFEVRSGMAHTVIVTTDPVNHTLETELDGVGRSAVAVTGAGQHIIHVDSTNSHGQLGSNLLQIESTPTPLPTLCLSLIH
jgi:hypothetical protein